MRCQKQEMVNCPKQCPFYFELERMCAFHVGSWNFVHSPSAVGVEVPLARYSTFVNAQLPPCKRRPDIRQVFPYDPAQALIWRPFPRHRYYLLMHWWTLSYCQTLFQEGSRIEGKLDEKVTTSYFARLAASSESNRTYDCNQLCNRSFFSLIFLLPQGSMPLCTARILRWSSQ